MCIVEDDFEDNQFMERIKHSLFGGGASPSASSTDVTVIKYAITVNIKPTYLVNKRRWRDYDQDKQKAILIRVENNMRKKNPSIVLCKMVFERCPNINNMHFHALYEMPSIFTTTVENFWQNQFNKGDVTNWRVLDIQPIYDEQGWIEYIYKDLKTNKA